MSEGYWILIPKSRKNRKQRLRDCLRGEIQTEIKNTTTVRFAPKIVVNYTQAELVSMEAYLEAEGPVQFSTYLIIRRWCILSKNGIVSKAVLGNQTLRWRVSRIFVFSFSYFSWKWKQPFLSAKKFFLKNFSLI